MKKYWSENVSNETFSNENVSTEKNRTKNVRTEKYTCAYTYTKYTYAYTYRIVSVVARGDLTYGDLE